MSNINIFEIATRQKLRFQHSRIGILSVEDLWDLTLVNLDDIAKGLNRQVKASQEESFLASNKSSENKVAETSLEVVKYVISVLEKEAADRKEAAAKADKRQQLVDALAQAEAREIIQLTPEEIRAQLESLDD